MAFQTAMLASDAFALLRSNMPGWKAQAQNALASMQSGNVDTAFIYRALDQLGAVIIAVNSWKAVVGLDAYATAQGYSGTASVDAQATAAAAQNVITWVFQNFPSSGGFVTDNTLNPDGSRTPRSFTPANTQGMQAALSAFIATIG